MLDFFVFLLFATSY